MKWSQCQHVRYLATEGHQLFYLKVILAPNVTWQTSLSGDPITQPWTLEQTMIILYVK